jgi:hypothetical protein
MRKTAVLGVAAAATLCVTAALAVQDGQTQDAAFMPSPESLKAMAPGPHHAQLAKLAGDYDIELKWRMGPDQPWNTNAYEAHREMVMDGRQLQEVIEGEFMGQPFRGESIVGYDNVRGEYHSVWFDNMGTGMMYVTGTADDSGAVTFEGTCSDPWTMEKNRWSKSVMSADGKLFDMYAKTPEGTVFKSMTIVYTPK